MSGLKRSASSEPSTRRPTLGPSASRRSGTRASDLGLASSQATASKPVSVPQYGAFRLSAKARRSALTGSP